MLYMSMYEGGFLLDCLLLKRLVCGRRFRGVCSGGNGLCLRSSVCPFCPRWPLWPLNYPVTPYLHPYSAGPSGRSSLLICCCLEQQATIISISVSISITTQQAWSCIPNCNLKSFKTELWHQLSHLLHSPHPQVYPQCYSLQLQQLRPLQVHRRTDHNHLSYSLRKTDR